MQDSGSLAEFNVTARDQGQYKEPSGAFVTHCNISCFVSRSLKFMVSVHKMDIAWSDRTCVDWSGSVLVLP